jgi:hypothetical protein
VSQSDTQKGHADAFRRAVLSREPNSADGAERPALASLLVARTSQPNVVVTGETLAASQHETPDGCVTFRAFSLNARVVLLHGAAQQDNP